MRACLQRVSSARVTVDGSVAGRIGNGLLLLLGVSNDDTRSHADLLLDKTLGLRIFPDGEGKMNLALADVGGELLVVSQFTLFADTSRGRRPSFLAAGSPEHANELYEYFVAAAREQGVSTATGIFGAMMDVELVNSGPVTIILDTDDWK
ncbi:MAG: D-tyrosyl-tRNA(Tyr) deacylase [Acidobacteriota bacterium]|nr:MAG: D-tyrosyl-tRNA(Tyr) deacylase [Acidobacteriota bacterium]